MWIVLGILGFLVLLITVILLLPVYVIVKTDDGEIMLRYKFLYKTFGENPNPDDPIVKMLKETTGAVQLESKNLQTSTKEKGLVNTVSETLDILTRFVKAVVVLLRKGTVKKLRIKIVCADEDPTKVAMNYGRCCALVSGALGFLHTFTRVRKRGQDIQVLSDFSDGAQGSFEFEVLIVLRVFRILKEFFRVAMEEARRADQSKS